MISFLEIKHFKIADDSDSGIVLSSKKKEENSKVNTLKSPEKLYTLLMGSCITSNAT